MTEAEQLADLRRRFPAWEIWIVPQAVQKDHMWCANPWARQHDRRNVLHAYRARDLATDLALAEQDGLHLPAGTGEQAHF